MNTKMYVGNLSFNSTEQDLRDLFGSHGEVTEVFIPTAVSYTHLTLPTIA